MTNLGLCLDFKHFFVGYPNAMGLETKSVRVIHRFLRHTSDKRKKKRGVPEKAQRTAKKVGGRRK